MKKTYLILIVLGLIPFVLASDVSVWQGQYYTGTTFNTGTYGFNFSVYDALTEGNICFSNTTTLTTGNWGEWKTEQSGVSFSCNNVSKDYYLNINIDGVDQTPRRRLVFFNFLRKDVNETANINIASYNLTANNGFFSYLGILTNRITKLFVQDIDTSGNITANYFIGNGSLLTEINSSSTNLTNYALKNQSETFAGNITTTQTGFFSFLGSLTNRVTTLFVQDIDASRDVTIGRNLNITGNLTIASKIELGTDDAFERKQIWNALPSSIFRLGALSGDGDSFNELSEGMVVYGKNVQGVPMASNNFSYARIKPDRF